MSFREHLQADLRLVLLRVLECAPGYECNSSILQRSVEDYGHNPIRHPGFVRGGGALEVLSD